MISGKKRIFHIIQSLDNGGCENMLFRTLPLVGEFEHTIITLKEPGELAPRFIEANICVTNIHCNSLFDIPGLLRLRTLIKKERPDLVLSYLFHADMAARFVLRDLLPLPPIPFLRTTYNHPKYMIARLLSRLTKPLVGRYIANSEAVKRFYTKYLGVSSDQIDVLPNGINTASFSMIPKNLALSQSLGITPDDTVIICVANLHPNKGHRYLLEAFEKLYLEHKEVIPAMNPSQLKLLIVGDGIEKENLKDQIKEYASKGNILFLGKRTDVPSLLRLSHIFVLPTLFEGMSNALMEAMAASLPVITTDIEENRELVKNNETGILVPVQNSDTLLEALEKLTQDPLLRVKLAQSGQAFIQENFSLEKISSNWNDLLKRCTLS